MDEIAIPSTYNGKNVIAIRDLSFGEYLIKISIPSIIVSIKYGAFENCEALNSVSISKSVIFIQQYAFAESGIASIIIPDTLENLDYRFFDFMTFAEIF